MQPSLAFPLTVAALTAALTSQNHLVVPAAATNTDAFSYEWIAGATRIVRQQTLIGQSHLTALQGRYLEAIELRRTAVVEAYQAGSLSLTVTLSTAPHTPIQCSNRWTDNVGGDAVQVFTGTLLLPASPATGAAGSPVAWTANNTLRIPFSPRFLYQGGTLCVDVTGQPVPGQETWWMADAAEEVVAGTQAVEIGAGCGIYGGPAHRWSEVATRSLVPGGRAQFRAEGPLNGFTMAAFGSPAAMPIPLSSFGINTPGCFCYLNPASILAVVPTTYAPEVHPLSTVGALAEVLVQLPADPSWYGVQMTTQWFDLTQLATSNAITWTVGNAIPALDMALNEGHPAEPTGNVTTYLAHVLRFEYL